MSNHPTYGTGGLKATPGCQCDYCVAVFDDWGRQAQEFQKVFDSGVLDRYLGIERVQTTKENPYA